ncbi:LytR/AlgR family response regulator transcription factor [Lewinella sp. IMCC34183]|uniref:LytR/AlgR family response regulator transcription factor n=1 Tax=Lewinella sp. IMCC34183 TaxID=2248762 RepID=UPI000E223334|nr:LytTR family DNA-binding domain-containing protein [Lewinella sp. IMCC34183]
MHTPACALLVEGNPSVASHVNGLLTRLGYKIADPFTCAADAVAYCQQTPPDLVVLGTETTRMLGPEATARLFHEHLDVAIILLKDIDQRSGNEVPRYADYTTFAMGVAQALGVGHPSRDFEPPQDYILHDRILLRHQERMVRVAISDIHYFRAERNYSRLYTPWGEYLIPISIHLVEHRLAHLGFFRTHRAYLVNHNFISEAQSDKLVINRHDVPIGRAYRRKVTRRVGEFSS